MARHTTVGKHLRIGVAAFLGAGLFAPGLDGALQGIGAPAVGQASAAISAQPTTSADDSAATATPDRGHGTDDSTAIPEATRIAEPSEHADRSPTPGEHHGTSTGSHSRDGGSDDEGISDEGVVHDGESGQEVESEVELHHEETNHVNAGSNTFSDDTTPVVELENDRPTAAAPSPILPAHIVAATALNAHGLVQARFHRGDRIALRIRWQTQAVRPGTKVTILWAVHHGRQAVYRHYRIAPAHIGRWRITAQARIPRTAQLGVDTFEGKVVVGRKASWHVFTLRVVR
jgi:hypothetical protein